MAVLFTVEHFFNKALFVFLFFCINVMCFSVPVFKITNELISSNKICANKKTII